MIDHQELQRLCGIPDPERLKKAYRQWIDAVLTDGNIKRESSWIESVAVGSRNFVEEIKVHHGVKTIGRKIREEEGTLLALRERSAAYNAHFATEKCSLSHQNTYLWDINWIISES